MDSARLPSGLSTVRSNEPEVPTELLKPAGLLERTAPMPKQGQKAERWSLMEDLGLFLTALEGQRSSRRHHAALQAG